MNHDVRVYIVCIYGIVSEADRDDDWRGAARNKPAATEEHQPRRDFPRRDFGDKRPAYREGPRHEFQPRERHGDRQ